MEQNQIEESRSRFLIKNLLRGLFWLGIILVAFILAEDYIQATFQRQIHVLKDKPVILFSIFFFSEVVFGIIPPVIFMTAWKLFMNVSLGSYVGLLSISALLSILAGFIGYYIGKNFSRSKFYKNLEQRYLGEYNKQLKKYGAFLVLVGALTPIPFSGTCMLAGSVDIPFRLFFWACSSRVFYFVLYGYIAWSFPELIM